MADEGGEKRTRKGRRVKEGEEAGTGGVNV